MRYLSLCVLLATATTASAQTPSPKGGDKIVPEPITLSGCVAAGERNNTYMLSNVTRVDKPIPVPVGTSGTAEPAAFYWLDSPGKLKSHVGHQVQIIGMLDDDVDKTEVKLKEGKVEVKAENGAKVEVPEGTVAAAAAAGPGTSKRLSYKVKVQSVTMLAGSCGR